MLNVKLCKKIPALRGEFAFVSITLFADLVTERDPAEFLLLLRCSIAPLITTITK